MQIDFKKNKYFFIHMLAYRTNEYASNNKISQDTVVKKKSCHSFLLNIGNIFYSSYSCIWIISSICVNYTTSYTDITFFSAFLVQKI